MDISYKNICRITFPVLLSLLVEQIIGITDTAFLGHVGKTELGASAIAGVCYLILFVIGSGFGVGLQVLIARLNGEKKNGEVTTLFSTGFYFLIFLAGVIIIASQFALPPILHQIIKSEDIYSAALLYLNWRIYGLFFAFIIVAFRAYYIGITKTKILSVCSLVMVVVNIICNYVLVFGKFGFPALGIEGGRHGFVYRRIFGSLCFYLILPIYNKWSFVRANFQYQTSMVRFEKDFASFRLDDVTIILIACFVVNLFCGYRTHRENDTCYIQYCEKYFGCAVYACASVCFHWKCISEQSDWRRWAKYGFTIMPKNYKGLLLLLCSFDIGWIYFS